MYKVSKPELSQTNVRINGTTRGERKGTNRVPRTLERTSRERTEFEGGDYITPGLTNLVIPHPAIINRTLIPVWRSIITITKM